jgi:uncharacterized membrane protein
MVFCSNCGTQVPGAFCPNCGAPAGAGAGPAPGVGGGIPQSPVAPSAAGMADNLASALCYIPFAVGLIVSIAFLVIAPYNQNKTIRFNAFQSLLIHVAVFLVFVVLGMLGAMMHVAGILGLGVLYPLISLGSFILLLYLAYSAYTNKKVVLPVIGEFAEKQA